jgi:hypothetical protein
VLDGTLLNTTEHTPIIDFHQIQQLDTLNEVLADFRLNDIFVI